MTIQECANNSLTPSPMVNRNLITVLLTGSFSETVCHICDIMYTAFSLSTILNGKKKKKVFSEL